MPKSIYVRKDGRGRLVPDDEYSAEVIRSAWSLGEVLRVEVSKPRNYEFHKKFFALVKIAFENQEVYDNFDEFRGELVMRAGYYEAHKHLSGRVSYHPKSISFGRMDDTEFQELYDRVWMVIIKQVLPGVDEDAFAEAVDEVMGFAA